MKHGRGSSRGMERHRERGAVLVMVAISMAALIGVVALALDIGYLLVTRNEVQNVADGSALAGARTLGVIYQDLTYSEQQGYYCGGPCRDSVVGVAQDVASQNRAGGTYITELEEVYIGKWSDGTFTQTFDQPDAVMVVARRDEYANGPVATFFARVLGIDEAGVNAQAVAAMTGQGNVGWGELAIPIAIDEYFWGEGVKCNEFIKFYPANDPASCAGWTSWEYGSNDITMRRILDEEEGYENPDLFASQSIINFTGGTLSTQVFNSLLELFMREGCATSSTPEVEAGESGLPRKYLDESGVPLEFLTGGKTDGCVDWMEVQKHDLRDNFELLVPDNKGNLVQAEWPNGDPRYLHQWETAVPVYEASDCSNPNQSKLIVGFTEVIITNVLEAPDKLVEGLVVCNRINPEPTRGGGGEYGLKGPIPGLVR